jgi:uncharacterized phage protein gp47/JayE
MAIIDLVYIDEFGFHAPDYPTVLQEYQDEYKAIYGADINLDDDTQDGQWLAISARAIFDLIQVTQFVYNSFSPATALNDALTRNVKINGISRLIPTFSQVNLDIIGSAGTVITSGQAEDTLGQKWNLPATVIIPLSGVITVTATATEIGEIPAQAGTVTKIATPTNGWQSVNNPLPATSGAPVESNADLRLRQSRSTMLPNQTVMDGIVGAVAQVTGVLQVRGYENDTDTTDPDTIPPYSIAIVAEGGIAQDIADAINFKKPAGSPTFGTTSVISVDSRGVPNTINFSEVVPVTIGVQIILDALLGYVSTTGDAIKIAVADYINSLNIGHEVYISKIYAPASLCNSFESQTFDIENGSIMIKKGAGAYDTVNIDIAFDEIAICTPADIDLIET